MIEIDGKLINPAHIVSAEVATVGSASGGGPALVVTVWGGMRICRRHGFGFDAYAELRKIQRAAAMPAPEWQVSAYQRDCAAEALWRRTRSPDVYRFEDDPLRDEYRQCVDIVVEALHAR